MIGSRRKLQEMQPQNFLSQLPWWGYPLGPSLPNRQAYPIFPWLIGPVTPTAPANGVSANTRCGRGMIVTVPTTVGAGGTITLTHNLGRIPQALIMIANGYVYPSRVCFAGVRTSTQVAVNFETGAAQGQQLWVL